MRKLQQRSTFSCTDSRERKRVTKESEMSKRKWQLSTAGSEKVLLIQVWNVPIRFHNYTRVCVVRVCICSEFKASHILGLRSGSLSYVTGVSIISPLEH